MIKLICVLVVTSSYLELTFRNARFFNWKEVEKNFQIPGVSGSDKVILHRGGFCLKVKGIINFTGEDQKRY